MIPNPDHLSSLRDDLRAHEYVGPDGKSIDFDNLPQWVRDALELKAASLISQTEEESTD